MANGETLTADENNEIPLEDKIEGRERILKHLPKMYELMLDIPGTHRARMIRVLEELTRGLP